MGSSTRYSAGSPSPGSEHTTASSPLEAAVLAEMNAAWRAGRSALAEFWFRRHPQLSEHAEVGVRIVYEEICLREDAGEIVDAEQIYTRFPQWREQLQVVLSCHRLLEVQHGEPNFPSVPARFGEFQLLKEIDRGAAGRVYLATQPGLSDRMLVVKLTLCQGDEHLSLARLQHSYIAPLFLVQDFAEQNLRALVMPYLGGMSWSRVLEQLRTTPPAGRNGQQIVNALSANVDEADEMGLLTSSPAGPAARFLGRATYEHAVCWLGGCLADAAHYAHQRGLVHLDIKPSNVLLAADGQPMLLDFHLALSLADADRPLQRLGGTRGYMSPEQLAASTALREGRTAATGLDGRSDVYSLGALLYESLCGKLPAANEAESRRELRRQNPQLSHGLEDILHKCLSRRPADRYPDANALAVDLRRQLADLPLAGVPNRSLRERWQKWRRRRPYAAPMIAVALAATLAVVGSAIVFGNEQLHSARMSLAQADRQIQQGQFELASEQLQSGLRAVRFVPGVSELKTTIREKLAQAQHAALARSLHDLVEQLRLLDSFERVPVAKLAELDASCAAVWNARDKVLQPAIVPGQQAAVANVRHDLVEFALLWTEVQLRKCSPDGLDAFRAAALRRVNEAEWISGPSRILELARHQYAAEPGDSPFADAGLRTSWEYLVVGRWLYRDGKFPEACDMFQQAVDLEPGAFWPHCYLALCSFQLGRLEAALTEANVCVALAPQNAVCYYNRAISQQALSRDEAALRDFDRALQLNSELGPVLMRRGILLTRLERYGEALQDLKGALAAGEEPAAVHVEIARLQHARHNDLAAEMSLRDALRSDAEYAPARDMLEQLQRPQ